VERLRQELSDWGSIPSANPALTAIVARTQTSSLTAHRKHS
jgi:hypothetical protein